MEALHSYLKTVDIPEGSRKGMRSAGYLVLPPYWYIFARDVNGSQDPLHDILQLWVISRESMAPWVIERFRRVHDADLVGKSLIGLQAAAEVAMCSLDVAPPEFKEHLDEQASLLNVPAVGSSRNTTFLFMQMNIVSTQPAGQAGDHMENELGRVGGKHFDGHDAAGGITSMITNSDIDPETEDWGWFVVCDLGVAIELREFIVVNFCGLRYHGGYTPTAKSGFAPKPWSHRFTVWFFQSIVQILYYFVWQIPAHLDIRIDFNCMAECFSARDPNDPTCRITAHPWKHRSDARELRDQAEQRYEAFASLQRKFVPKGVLMKLGQEARRRAKSLALLGAWESNASGSGKATTKVASASHKRRGPRTEAATVLDVHHGMQMSHVEISPLANTESGSSDDNGEWVDMDPNDLDYKDVVPIAVDVFGAGPSLRGHPDDNEDDDPMDMDVNASSSAPHRYKLRKQNVTNVPFGAYLGISVSFSGRFTSHVVPMVLCCIVTRLLVS
ncbi:hypothetical protein GSI_09471 [Ganoderma sinense ZZ0214-1]|uniref:Uncharacterized protein n=1 Tax=Ganoderma sinense ZZ0214-1 TaxID=1077348 RepID=A0A2G8S6L5_9APHY|nr:hypothetical protein GSI_09471 [Ganoderma sinense ZZ0214-1]